MPRLKPDHAEVTGGLDAKKNQLEARFGQTVTYTLQLHADPEEPGGTLMGEHVAVGPDRSGNKYTLVTKRSYLVYETSESTPTTTPAPRVLLLD